MLGSERWNMKQHSLLSRVVLSLATLALLWLVDPRSQPAAARSLADPEVPARAAVAEVGSSRLSIPAAAFVPSVSTYSYENHGRYLKHLAGTPVDETGYYVAPVQLPQGATITRLTFYFKDSTAGQAEASLIQHKHYTNSSTALANLVSSDTWAPGLGSASTSSFTQTPLIDNTLYSYHVSISLPPGGTIWACGIEIDYTPPPQTPASGVLTVPAAAFTPYEDGYAFFNFGWILSHNSGGTLPDQRGWYLAPVHFPHGATVTKMTFYWIRADAQQVGIARLQRSQLGFDTYADMAVASSEPGSGGFIGSSTDSTIDQAVIDNNRFAYWLVLDLPPSSMLGSQVQAFDVEIHFQVPQTTRTRISVPAAAFRPYEDGYDFQDHGRHLFHSHGPGGNSNNGWYMAPLNLRDGVTIKRMSFYWYQNGAQAGVAKLQRTRLGEANYEDLATASSSIATVGNGSSFDATVVGGPIDNSQYAYWIVWDLPANASASTGVHGQAVVLDVSYRVALPLTINNSGPRTRPPAP
jgi:hypothetical protein